MEQLDEDFVGTHLGRRRSDHTKKRQRGQRNRRSQQQAAIAGTEADTKLEPIRNRGNRKSAATIPAPAAAARSTSTAACAKAAVI